MEVVFYRTDSGGEPVPVRFTVQDTTIVLVHGVIKESQKIAKDKAGE